MKTTTPSIENFKLNPFFRIQIGEPILCDIFLENNIIELPSIYYLKMIVSLAKKSAYSLGELISLCSSIFTVPEQQSSEIIHDLIANNLLISVDKNYPELQGVNHWVERGWLEALFLHLKSRNIAFADNAVSNPDDFNSEVLKNQCDQEGPPEFWKVTQGKKVCLLSANELPNNRSFQEILLSRRSHSKWRATGIRLQEISNILYYANVETVRLRKFAETHWREDAESILNSAFSALETYLLVFNIDNIQNGLYHYEPQNHQLSLMKEGSFRNEISKICIGQQRPGQAACAIIISAVWKRYMYRYKHPRAYRTLLINVAELAQKYIILGTTFGLSTFLTPALEDQYADHFLNFNGYEEAALYVVGLG